MQHTSCDYRQVFSYSNRMIVLRLILSTLDYNINVVCSLQQSQNYVQFTYISSGYQLQRRIIYISYLQGSDQMLKSVQRIKIHIMIACCLTSIAIGVISSIAYAEGEVPENPTPPASPEIEAMGNLLENSSDPSGSENPIIISAQTVIPSPSENSVIGILSLDPWYLCVNDSIDGTVDGVCHYNSIQAAINDFIIRNGFGVITIETGTFTEDIAITNIPNLTGLVGENPFVLTSINGNLLIQTQSGFLIQNLDIQGGISFNNSSGAVTISNVEVSNPQGNAIELMNHSGDIIIQSIHAASSEGYGLRIRGSSGSISIQDSIFNNNYSGASIFTNGEVYIEASTMNENENSGLEILNANSVYIFNSAFLKNQGVGVAGLGVLAQGPIVISNVNSNSNRGDGILIFSTSRDIFISDSVFNKNGMYGLRLFWPAESMLSTSHVTSCENIIGSAFFLGSLRVGTIYDCVDTNEGYFQISGFEGNLYQRIIILNQTTFDASFLQDIPTLVLLQDNSVTPPLTYSRIIFPVSDMSTMNNIHASILDIDTSSTPPPDGGIWNTQVVQIIATDDIGNPLTEIDPAFTFCYTNATSDNITQVAFLPTNDSSWQIIEPQQYGDQICFQQNSTGSFAFGKPVK
jgi:hypothetical protein